VKKLVSSFAAGVLFAAGLVISGMSRPEKVLGFLDFTGRWDASLALVMGTAIPIYAIAYRLTQSRGPKLDDHIHLPRLTHIDKSLIVGSVLFGVGWGIVGYCPGPAVLSVVTGNMGALCFVFAMLGGMALYEMFVSAVARAQDRDAKVASSD